MIKTAREIYKANRRINSFADWFTRWTKRRWNPAVFYLGMKLEARINHSRWVVDCPFCPGAETIWPGEDWFLCGGCKNNQTGLAIRIILPEEREEIEDVLMKRPKAENRNWSPGESVEDLVRENKQKGVV